MKRKYGDLRTSAQKRFDSEWDRIRLPILVAIKAKEQRARRNRSYTK